MAPGAATHDLAIGADDATPLVASSVAPGAATHDFWIGMSSVDKFDITYETTLKRRQRSQRGVGFPCLKSLPHSPKRTWLHAPLFQCCPRFSHKALNFRNRADVLCWRCRRITRKDAPIAHGEESARPCVAAVRLVGEASPAQPATVATRRSSTMLRASWDMVEGR